MKKTSIAIAMLLLALCLLVSCGADTPTSDATLNGADIAEYVIVYSEKEPDYNKNAAEYIRDSIHAVVGVELSIVTDDTPERACEIVVGETARAISATLNADAEGLAFATLANGTHIAMEGDYFVIAAAAYSFVNTHVTSAAFDATVPETITVGTPAMEAPKNFILLIGDGMGLYQTKLFDYAEPPKSTTNDGEDLFYGYLLPYCGEAKTNSLSGTTDSAAAGTALATGYKTFNGYIGLDKDQNEVMSLTELANTLGKASAVMSTEKMTGATPAAFSAHADSRNNSLEIEKSQRYLEGTVLQSLVNSHKDEVNNHYIADVLGKISTDEDGFFIMYEEAYIDKHCHDNDMDWTYKTLLRFNQAIGQFMEFAFYHPDTLVIITADHETGALKPNANGNLQYNSEEHSFANVPLFAWGMGAEIFDGQTVENVQIPKTIAKMWGVADFGDPTSPFPALQ